MKLYYDRKSKNPTYYIQVGIRNGKKVTTKNVYKIGKHSELIEQGHNDPLSYAKDYVKKYNEDFNSKKIETTVTIDFNKKLTPSENVSSKSTSVNTGYFVLQKIYSALKIKSFLNEKVSNKKVKFDVDTINRFLIFDRILNPRSKLVTVNNLDFFYEKPKFTHQQVLRFMDILAENYDEYLTHLFKASNNIVKRDTSVCYYDCTNYYFEIERADGTYIDDITGEEIYELRQFGPCKEHRPNPIVEMGLFMDKDGIPITMGIYPGNLNEQQTIAKIEPKMIKSLENKKIIYCGDAGVGSASIRAFNDMGGRAFIVTQSIKKLTNELKEKVFENSGFKLLSSNEDISLEKMKTFKLKSDEENQLSDEELANNLKLYNDKAYKVIPVDSNIDLGLYEEKVLKNGKTVQKKSTAKLRQNIIITYSRKMAEYQKAIRNKQIERAKDLIKKGVDDVRKGPNDIARFIKNKDNKKNEYILNEEKIANEEKYDGFYAVATNLIDDKAQDILEINSQRYKIEDCFRVLKTNFDARPIYHQLDNRITAHFMICYSALLVYRLLEKQLQLKNYKFKINDIISTLKNMKVANRDDIYYEADYTSSKVCTAFNDLYNLGLDKKYYMPSELSKKIKNLNK